MNTKQLNKYIEECTSRFNEYTHYLDRIEYRKRYYKRRNKDLPIKKIEYILNKMQAVTISNYRFVEHANSLDDLLE